MQNFKIVQHVAMIVNIRGYNCAGYYEKSRPVLCRARFCKPNSFKTIATVIRNLGYRWGIYIFRI